MGIGPDKKRIWLTLDKDVLEKAKAYAAKRITLSSMINKMLADALGMSPRDLKARLPEVIGPDGEDANEDEEA